MNSRRIGFISTRFAGNDGVSLEAAKWAEVLESMGHQCFYFCGESDRPTEVSFVVPEAFYRHPVIDEITNIVFTPNWGHMESTFTELDGLQKLRKDFFSIYIRPEKTTRQIQELKTFFKENLKEFAFKFQLDALIVENALTIPVNIPLGLAVTEFIA